MRASLASDDDDVPLTIGPLLRGTGELRTLYKRSWKIVVHREKVAPARASPSPGAPNARVEAPYTSPSSRPAFAKAAIAVPTSSSLSAAFMIVRIRAFPFATIG